MISRLTGTILDKESPCLLIDVKGIGYEVLVSLNSFFDTPEVGESVTLHTHFVVREDSQQLYGFSRQEERQLFRLLIKVNGVGPKMAIAILSGMSHDEFIRCVDNDDILGLVKLPGVGKKTAQRLLMEMRDKLDNITRAPSGDRLGAEASVSEMSREAESALIALGYKPQEASRMIKRVACDQIDNVEQLIREALRNTVA